MIFPCCVCATWTDIQRYYILWNAFDQQLSAHFCIGYTDCILCESFISIYIV